MSEHEPVADGGSNDLRASRHSTTPPSKSRAVQLLGKILGPRSAPIEDVAQALMVAVKTVEAYRAGRRPMPLEQQLLLAAYTIECAPEYARLGHRLRGQVAAAIAFAARETSAKPALPEPRRW